MSKKTQLCQAQKKAIAEGKGLTESELKRAFKKAKDKGGTVVGNWFEK